MHGLRAVALSAVLIGACGGSAVSPKDNICSPPACASAMSSYAVEIVGNTTSALPQTELTGVTLDNTTGVLALNLGASMQVTGHVTSNGAPVAASVVFTRPSLIPGRPDVYYETTSDPTSGGAFSVTLPSSVIDAPYTVRVRPTDSASYPPYTQPLQTSTQTMLEVKLPSGTNLLRFSGSLANAVAVGINQAKVVLRDAKTLDDLSTTTTTDVNGNFSLLVSSAAAGGADGIVLVAQQGDVSTGQLTLTMPIDASQVVQATSTNAMRLALPALPATTHLSIPVVGTASSGTMTPVTGATFRIWATLSDASSSSAVVHEVDGQTDASGKIQADLYGGTTTARTYQVTIVPPADKEFESPPVPLTVSVGASSGVTQQLTLATRPLLSGRVLDAAGTALKGASLQPQLSTVTANALLSTVASFTTDPSGRFGLYVDPGTYDVGVTPPAMAMLPRRWLARQTVASDLDLGDIQLSPAVMFDVVLREAMMPAQATVRLFVVPGADPDCDSTSVGCYAAPQLEAEVATGSDGSATMLLPAQTSAH